MIANTVTPYEVRTLTLEQYAVAVLQREAPGMTWMIDTPRFIRQTDILTGRCAPENKQPYAYFIDTNKAKLLDIYEVPCEDSNH